MTIAEALARPLLAGVFVYSGIDTLRNPSAKVPVATPILDPLSKATGLTAERIVTVNAGVQVAAGIAARGRACSRGPPPPCWRRRWCPRRSPAHRFWEQDGREARTQHLVQVLKNVAMLGGLVLAATSHGGRPSLPWRARRAARHLVGTAGHTHRSAAPGELTWRRVTRSSGRRSTPRIVSRSRQCGSPSSATSGNRRITDVMATFASSLASDGAEAVVDAGGERQVAVGVRPVEAQGVRVVEHRRVVVGRAEDRHHGGAGRDLDVAVAHGLHRDADRLLHRTVVAQQLVDGRRVERRVVAPAGELVGVAQQGQHAVADQVDGGLVAGDVEQRHERDQLGGAQPVAGLLDEQQLRQQVVAEVAGDARR